MNDRYLLGDESSNLAQIEEKFVLFNYTFQFKFGFKEMKAILSLWKYTSKFDLNNFAKF